MPKTYYSHKRGRFYRSKFLEEVNIEYLDGTVEHVPSSHITEEISGSQYYLHKLSTLFT